MIYVHSQTRERESRYRSRLSIATLRSGRRDITASTRQHGSRRSARSTTWWSRHGRERDGPTAQRDLSRDRSRCASLRDQRYISARERRYDAGGAGEERGINDTRLRAYIRTPHRTSHDSSERVTFHESTILLRAAHIETPYRVPSGLLVPPSYRRLTLFLSLSLSPFLLFARRVPLALFISPAVSISLPRSSSPSYTSMPHLVPSRYSRSRSPSHTPQSLPLLSHSVPWPRRLADSFCTRDTTTASIYEQIRGRLRVRVAAPRASSGGR